MKTRLSTKGQVVVPKSLRSALSLEPGDELLISVANGSLVMTPLERDAWRRLRGCLAPGLIDALERDHHEERAKEARR